MNKSILLPFFILLVCSSCAGHSKKVKEALVNNDGQFNYTDKNGQFIVHITSGMDKKAKAFFTKKTMLPSSGDKDKALEQSVVFSSVGSLKNKTSILRPKVSQYHVWFEGKKYTTELKLNVAKKAIDVKMTSPEAQWNGVKQVKFQSTKVVPCFFSQVIECAKVMGFISKASDKKRGVMNFVVIWEGYPYLNETFSDFPSELFSKAELEYDGQTKEGDRRFNLRVGGQSIFYVLDKKDSMVKMFWVSQGITMVAKGAASNSDSSDSNDDGSGGEGE
jgi:hypothetical protein